MTNLTLSRLSAISPMGWMPSFYEGCNKGISDLGKGISGLGESIKNAFGKICDAYKAFKYRIERSAWYYTDSTDS